MDLIVGTVDLRGAGVMRPSVDGHVTSGPAMGSAGRPAADAGNSLNVVALDGRPNAGSAEVSALGSCGTSGAVDGASLRTVIPPTTSRCTLSCGDGQAASGVPVRLGGWLVMESRSAGGRPDGFRLRTFSPFKSTVLGSGALGLRVLE